MLGFGVVLHFFELVENDLRGSFGRALRAFGCRQGGFDDDGLMNPFSFLKGRLGLHESPFGRFFAFPDRCDIKAELVIVFFTAFEQIFLRFPFSIGGGNSLLEKDHPVLEGLDLLVEAFLGNGIALESAGNNALRPGQVPQRRIGASVTIRARAAMPDRAAT